MAKKLDKHDVKNPDIVTQELRKGFEWTTQHSTSTIIAVVVFLVAGGGYSVMSYFKTKKEADLQEKYFAVEKPFLDKKNQFELFESNAAQAKAKPDPKTDPKTKGVQPTGNLDTDYGTTLSALKSFASTAPNSKAGRMAALNASEVYLKYKNPDSALETLKSVSIEKDPLSAMVLSQIGDVQAEKGDCKAAIDSWSKVLTNVQAQFLYPAVKLKQGLCFESLKDTASAEKLYNEVKESGSGPLASSAEAYLRALKSTQ